MMPMHRTLGPNNARPTLGVAVIVSRPFPPSLIQKEEEKKKTNPALNATHLKSSTKGTEVARESVYQLRSR